MDVLSNSPVDDSRLRVKYSGDSLAVGRMDVEQFTDALDGLREALLLCGQIVNGVDVESRLTISAELRAGSFGFEVVLSQIAGSVGSMITAENLKSSLEMVKFVFGEGGLISLFKKTMGEPPSRVDHSFLDDGSVQVNGTVHGSITVNTTVNKFVVDGDQWACYERPGIRKAIWDAIKPLTDQGIDEVEFVAEDGDKSKVQSLEARFFEPRRDAEVNSKDAFFKYEDNLVVVKQSFARHRRWVFESVTKGVFGALITDSDFLARQDRREINILKGDRIIAEVSVRGYTKDPRSAKPREPDYFISRVIKLVQPDENYKQRGFDF